MSKKRMLKRAEVGIDADVSFEKAFANVAHAYLREKVPRLMEHQVGFQLVEKNDDGAEAAGVFAFNVGGRWLYIPVFFRNGELKGAELLYLKGANLFVPAKDNWVNYLLSRAPSGLGEAISQTKKQELGPLPPDLRRLAMSPTKYASARFPLWAQAFLPTYAEAKLDPDGESLRTEPRLPAMLKRGGAKRVRDFLGLLKAWPELGESVLEHYDVETLKQAAAEAREVKPGRRPKRLLDGLAKEADGQIVIYTMRAYLRRPQIGALLSEEERRRLRAGGVIIRDNRPDEAVTRVYRAPQRSFQNPTRSGAYEVLDEAGNLVPCWVVVPNDRLGGSPGEALVWAVGKTDQRPDQIYRDALWARQVKEPDGRSIWDVLRAAAHPAGGLANRIPNRGGAPDSDRVLVFLAILEDGKVAGPFCVWRRIGRADGTVVLDVSMSRTLRERGDADSSSRLSRSEPRGGQEIGEVWISPRKRWCLDGGRLRLPDDAPVMSWLGPPDQSIPFSFLPGDWHVLMNKVLNKYAHLRVWSDGLSAQVNEHPIESREAALIRLVRDYGLREKVAEQVLNEAARTGKGHYFLKMAQPLIAPSGPPVLPPERGVQEAFGRIVETVPSQFRQEGVTGMETADTLGTDYSAAPIEREVQQVLEAAKSGRREVLDLAMLGALMRLRRVDSALTEDIKEIIQGMDRIGRLLLRLYMHRQQFEDRYGEEGVNELEDSLQTAFEDLGDLVLFLKQREVQSLAGEDIDLDLDEAGADEL